MEEHTSEKIKRGVDLQNRLWDGENNKAKRVFNWWKGKGENKFTYLLIALLVLLNLYIVFPIFGKDTTLSYSSSVFFSPLSQGLQFFNIPPKIFFLFLTVFSLNFTVFTYYIFVRRVVHRHELTAFISTLFFILPNPLFANQPPLAASLLQGDGAHVFAFSFIPLLLLSIQSYISKGEKKIGIFSILCISLIAIISPFAFFNLGIFSFVIAVSEGFLGQMRLKLGRVIFLFIFSCGLSLFWYYPNFINNVSFASHVIAAARRAWAFFPIIIPAIPLFGTLSFLIFDRRPILKPIFIGITIFVIYFFLVTASKSIHEEGIFLAERYLVEMYFAISFLMPLVIVLFGEFFFKKLKHYLEHKSHVLYFLLLTSISAVVSFTIFLVLFNVRSARTLLLSQSIIVNNNILRGRGINIYDIGTDIATFISLVLFIYLLVLSRKRVRFL